jgi:HSP20 family protein
MRLMRWEPLREMDDLLKGFATPLFGRMPTVGRLGDSELEFLPPADVIERDHEYIVRVDLPDVRKEDVEVLFDAGVLTIKGERKVEHGTKGEKVHRTERFHGAFARSFALPEDVDTKGIRAEAKEGVLVVTLPRVAVAKPRPLAITIQ